MKNFFSNLFKVRVDDIGYFNIPVIFTTIIIFEGD